MTERRHLLECMAGKLLLEGGIDAVTHRRVAARAHVPLGSTTYYFVDLADLRARAVTAAARSELQRARSAVPARRSRSRIAIARTLVDIVIGESRLNDRLQVAAVYHRLLQASTNEVARAAAAAWQEGFVDVVGMFLDLNEIEAPPPTVLATVDGRVIGWLSTSDAPHILIAHVRHDLALLEGWRPVS